jgi:large subunit ribosomal protein L15
MGTTLSSLQPASGSRRKRHRVGRGSASGTGGTSGKGHKGQKARSGGGHKPRGFEGGQMPLSRRIPKRGFRNPSRVEYAIVNVRDLAHFEPGSVVDVDVLRAAGRIPRAPHGVKILGDGELDRPLTVRAAAVTASARAKIEAAGGSVTLTD